jgi:3-dehydroquinate synthetase
MGHDKKVRDGKVTFILARGIGKAYVAADVDIAEVRAMLEAETLAV